MGRVWDTIKQHIWVNGSAEATFFDDENEEANKEGIPDEEHIPMGEKQQILILLFLVLRSVCTYNSHSG